MTIKSKLADNTDLLQPTVAINLQKIETCAVSASDSEFNWKNIMTKVSSVITGAAGEHFVMAELLRRGLVAAKAPEGVPNFDIVITDIGGERLAAIQVKTRRDFKSGDKGWHMKAKHEKLSSDRIFYVFVDVGKDEASQVSFYVLPSSEVAYVCKRSHENWLETPSANGKERGDTEMRRLMPKYELPAYALKNGYQPSKQHQKFLKNYGEGWMEKYRSAWNLISQKI